MDHVLARIPRVTNSNVLVGYDTADDAGVYQLTDDCALVQTVDFFTPIVDDPSTFGAIAAANALSDVYAMGGRPISALSILAYPGKGDLDDLAEILAGGAEKMREADCAILGGHSVNDEEVKFGYAVTGTVHPQRIWTNTGARPGDVLVFTKRLGTGVISTALKRGLADPAHVAAAVESMLTLNRKAAEALAQFEVHGCTDVTGFGFIGHARELALGSNVTLEIDTSLLRFLPGAVEYARAGAIRGACATIAISLPASSKAKANSTTCSTIPRPPAASSPVSPPTTQRGCRNVTITPTWWDASSPADRNQSGSNDQEPADHRP